MSNLLSAGHLVNCHRFLIFLFAAILFFISGEQSSTKLYCRLLLGVDSQADCWTHSLNTSTADEIFSAPVNGTCVSNVALTMVRKCSQLVFLLWSLQFGTFLTTSVVKVITTGEWSEDNSKQDSHLTLVLGIPLVMQKSIKSGLFFGSVGQYVGWPDETTLSPCCSIHLRSSLPLGRDILEPHCTCLAL